MKEIPLRHLIKAFTARRILNAALAVFSFLVSALIKKPVVWGKPFILTIEPTNLCNLRCPLCVTGNGRMTRSGGAMDFETFQKIIDENDDRLIYLLLYQQGEPFLNKAFLDFVEYASRRDIFVTTSSNAHYFDPETAQRTVASGLDSLIVSIDGADQASYARYRVGGDLERVKKGVANLIAERGKQGRRTPMIYLQFIAMQHNEHQIPAMKKLTRELGADKLLVKTAHVETPEEAQQWLPQKASLRRYSSANGRLTPKRKGAGPCPRPWTSSLVNWDGTVVPCCFDKNAAHPLGGVNRDAFTTIWNSEEYDQFRTTMLNHRADLDICANCSQGLRLFV